MLPYRCSKRKEREYPCPFNGSCHIPLMLGAVSGNSPRGNLAALAYKLLKDSEILIICFHIFIGAKAANLFLLKGTFASKLLLATLRRRPWFSSVFTHGFTSLDSFASPCLMSLLTTAGAGSAGTCFSSLVFLTAFVSIFLTV